MSTSRVVQTVIASALSRIFVLSAVVIGSLLTSPSSAADSEPSAQTLKSAGIRVSRDKSGQITRAVLKRKTLVESQLSALEKLRGLTYLNLTGVKVSDDACARLARLSKLEKLVLRKSGVSDAGLAKLAKLTRLKWLDVAGSDVTDKGLDTIRKLPVLRTVVLSCPGVSRQAISDLRTDMPKLRIAELWRVKFVEHNNRVQMITPAAVVTFDGTSSKKKFEAEALIQIEGPAAVRSVTRSVPGPTRSLKYDRGRFVGASIGELSFELRDNGSKLVVGDMKFDMHEPKKTIFISADGKARTLPLSVRLRADYEQSRNLGRTSKGLQTGERFYEIDRTPSKRRKSPPSAKTFADPIDLAIITVGGIDNKHGVDIVSIKRNDASKDGISYNHERGATILFDVPATYRINFSARVCALTNEAVIARGVTEKLHVLHSRITATYLRGKATITVDGYGVGLSNQGSILTQLKVTDIVAKTTIPPKSFRLAPGAVNKFHVDFDGKMTLDKEPPASKQPEARRKQSRSANNPDGVGTRD